MKHTIYYAYNGYHAEHAGSKETCQKYIAESGRDDLTLCIHTGDRYRPVLETRKVK